MTDADLICFVNAQAQVYSQVIEELADGSKLPTGCGSFFRN